MRPMRYLSWDYPGPKIDTVSGLEVQGTSSFQLRYPQPANIKHHILATEGQQFAPQCPIVAHGSICIASGLATWTDILNDFSWRGRCHQRFPALVTRMVHACRLSDQGRHDWSCLHQSNRGRPSSVSLRLGTVLGGCCHKTGTHFEDLVPGS